MFKKTIPKLILGVLLMTGLAWGQDIQRSGMLRSANSTPSSACLTGLPTAADDTSEVISLANAYDKAIFVFKRVSKTTAGYTITNTTDADSANVKFLMQGSTVATFPAALSALIDSGVAIGALDTARTTVGSYTVLGTLTHGTITTSSQADQFDGTVNVPWNKGFPYIRFIMDNRAGADDTITYIIDYVLSRKPK